MGYGPWGLKESDMMEQLTVQCGTQVRMGMFAPSSFLGLGSCPWIIFCLFCDWSTVWL